MNLRQIRLVGGWVCITGPGPAQSRALTVIALKIGRLKSRALQSIILTKYYKWGSHMLDLI